MNTMQADKNFAERLDVLLGELPLIAILRGLRTDGAQEMVEGLLAAGIRIAEVPLNSPDPYVTIRQLVARFGDEMVIGAGTVTCVDEVERLAETGCMLVVSPNCDPEVIQATLAAGVRRQII